MSGKIPGECRVCTTALTRSEMEDFLKLCEDSGRDPATQGDRGILCTRCLIRELTDQAEDDPNSNGAKVLRAMRRDHLGIKRVK